MKGFKAFTEDLKCRDMQFKVGHTYSVDGEIIPCKNGIHFCEQLKDVYNYYSKSYSTRICEVEAIGSVISENDKSVTDNIRIVRELSKDEIKALTDDLRFNSGNYNSGNYNSGYYNSGYYNSGDCNSGDCNSGDCNSGNYNSGDCNSGDCNSGNYNSGNYNSGDCNSGDYNSGDCNSGDCNTNNPTVRLFNKDSGWSFLDDNHLLFRNILHKYTKPKLTWVHSKDMTDEEKTINKSHETTGGFLRFSKTIYNGKKISEGDRDFLLSVPNFDAKILEETTGIVLKNTKTIVLDGKKLEISEESFEEFKKQFKGE